MKDDLLKIINAVQEFAGRATIPEWDPKLSLRDDLGFDSLDLAELTVRIQDRFGSDVFESGIIDTLEQLAERVGSDDGR